MSFFSPYGITSAENFPNQAINNCRDLKPGRRRLIARQIHKSLLRNTGFLKIFLAKKRVGPENRIGNNGATQGQGDSVVQPGKKKTVLRALFIPMPLRGDTRFVGFRPLPRRSEKPPGAGVRSLKV